MDGQAASAFEANASSLRATRVAVVDSAAALVVGLESDARTLCCKPLARIVGYGIAGVDPRIMGFGPVPATQKALANAGIKSGSDRYR